MKSKYKWGLLALCVATGAGVLLWPLSDGVAAPPVQRPEASEGSMMRSKLKRAQSMLEGLLRKDFGAVAVSAKQMKLISEAAEWPRGRDRVYEHFSTEFRRQCAQLEQLAADENHQGVTFSYLRLTSLCIECHDYVRDSMRVATPSGRAGIQLIPSQWPEQHPVPK